MNDQHVRCSDERLLNLLHSDQDGDDVCDVVAHLENCSRCQERLEALAAQSRDWRLAQECLSLDDAMNSNDHDDDPGSMLATKRWRRVPSGWSESMAKRLLAPPSHPEMLGRIGRYEVERVIGSGGMGVVFKAFDTELNRPVAVKVLAPYLAGSGAARKRFAREARAAAAIVHEHVVAIHNVETEGDSPFLVMHYVAGESLQQRLDRDGWLELCEILRIGLQTAAGLAAAHAQGLVHRDVKPSNILLELGIERTLLTDFGLARANDDVNVTFTGCHPGTPQYMSPEQARGEAINARSDLFSLGSVLYAMCTGRAPFRAENTYGILRRITDSEPRPIREINPHIPEWLCGIIAKLISKQESDRYQSAIEVAELLEECLAHVQQPATVPLPESVASVVASRKRRPPASITYRATKIANCHRTEVIITAVTITLIAGVIAGVWHSSTEHQLTKEVLSDIKLLAELKDEHPNLLPAPHAARRETMESWIDRSVSLTERLAAHRATLGTLRGKGQKVKAASGSEDNWQFTNPTLQLQHDNLQQLVQGIETLGAPSGMIEQTKGWALRMPFPSEIETKWVTACKAIEATHAIQLNPCEGLYALGTDPQSQLWEFVDLRFGLAPRRDEKGRLVISPETGFVFVLLPGDRLRMGSPESEIGRKNSVANEQQHDVELSPFFISKYEVTQAQWEKIMGQNPSEHLGPLRAVHKVSWIDCDQYCQKTGLILPTEAQWEYACRAGTTEAYNVPALLNDIGWYVGNSFDSVHVVGEKLPNRFGLYDMHGNVLEWCQDVFAADFYLQPEASGRDPVNKGDSKESNKPRVLRGGSFEGVASYLRSADRYFEKPERRWRGFGLRPIWQVSVQE